MQAELRDREDDGGMAVAGAIARWTKPMALAPSRIGQAEVLHRLLRAVVVSQPPTDVLSETRLAVRSAGHFLRCARHLATYRDWFGNAAHVALREEIALRPALLTLAIHPYLNAEWPVARKLAAIGAHYDLLHGKLDFLRFARADTLVLADIGEGLGVRLEKLAKFDHEGELVISLFCGERRIYCLAFTLGTIGPQTVAYAGALQGANSEDALAMYRTLTHRLEKMRPRDLLITAFRLLCASLGVARILAVADSHRVCSRPYFKSSVRVFSSYDSAWTECGGTARGDGFFELDPGVARRPAGETPARKRAQYRRRYVLVDACARQIDEAIAAARAAVLEPMRRGAADGATDRVPDGASCGGRLATPIRWNVRDS